MEGSPGSRHQMQTFRSIAALVAQEAGIANVAGRPKPNPRQGDSRVGSEALNDRLQYTLGVSLGSHVDGEAEESVSFHEDLLG